MLMYLDAIESGRIKCDHHVERKTALSLIIKADLVLTVQCFSKSSISYLLVMEPGQSYK